MAATLGWSETAAAGWLVLVAGWWGSLTMLTETKREVQWREREGEMTAEPVGRRGGFDDYGGGRWKVV